MNKRIICEYHNGVEIIKGKKIYSHASSDNWILNLFLVVVSIIFFYLSESLKITYLQYIGAFFYVLSIFDFFKSNTRKILKQLVEFNDFKLGEKIKKDIQEKPVLTLKYPKQ